MTRFRPASESRARATSVFPKLDAISETRYLGVTAAGEANDAVGSTPTKVTAAVYQGLGWVRPRIGSECPPWSAPHTPVPTADSYARTVDSP
jgi:hypothetical protein